MSRWFRWKGIIAFAAVAGLLSALWLLLADSYAKRTIERTGTALVGAKVELDGADISLFPLGLTLERLQVTNPGEPMKNAVEAHRVSFLMDGVKLLRRKVIIDEMSVEGVRFGTPRSRSGALREKPEEPRPMLRERLGLPSFSLPDIKEVLAKEELETLRLVEQTRADIEDGKQKWPKRIGELPGKEAISGYEERVKGLKAATKGGPAGLLGSAAEAKALKDEIQADINRIKEAREELDSSLKALKERVDEATRAPGKDFNRLREKYSLTPEGLANATGLLVGEEAGAVLDKALTWYRKLTPLLEKGRQAGAEKKRKPPRGKGTDVRFREYEPLPAFLVRVARADISTARGDIAGKIEHITTEQHVTGKPTTFAFSGQNLKDVGSVSLSGALDHVDPPKARDTLALSVKGLQIRDAKLSEGRELPVTLEKGVLGADLAAVVLKDSISADLTGSLRSASISAGAGDESGRVVQEVLAGVSDLNFKASVSGTPEDYSLRISSDLDRALKASLGRQFSKKAAAWEQDLRAAISEKTGAPLSGLKDSLNGLAGLDGELQGRLGGLTDLTKELASSGVPGLKLPF